MAPKKKFDFDRKPLAVIVAANYKGGVGKTTTSRVLVQGFAHFPEYHNGKPILYIDLDPQGNTSKRWNLLEVIDDAGTKAPRPHPQLVLEGEENPRTSICDLWVELLEGGNSFEPVPYPSDSAQRLEDMNLIPKEEMQPIGNEYIHVVPNDEARLVDIQSFKRGSEQAKRAAEVLRQWLRSPELAEKYSFVVIDTPPTKTAIMDIVIHAATHIYIPFQPEPQSVDGVLSMISYFQTKVAARRESEDLDLNFLGMLPNIVQKKTLIHQQQLNRIEDSPVLSKYLMKTPLNKAVAYPETDNWRNTPDQVFADKGTTPAIQATRFVKAVAQQVMEDRESWERFA